MTSIYNLTELHETLSIAKLYVNTDTYRVNGTSTKYVKKPSHRKGCTDRELGLTYEAKPATQTVTVELKDGSKVKATKHIVRDEALLLTVEGFGKGTYFCNLVEAEDGSTFVTSRTKGTLNEYLSEDKKALKTTQDTLDELLKAKRVKDNKFQSLHDNVGKAYVRATARYIATIDLTHTETVEEWAKRYESKETEKAIMELDRLTKLAEFKETFKTEYDEAFSDEHLYTEL